MCGLCLQTPCHPRCPNYSPINTNVFCDKCGEMIGIYDEYIENEYGNAAHLDCFYGIKDLLDWLEVEIKVTENEK